MTTNKPTADPGTTPAARFATLRATRGVTLDAFLRTAGTLTPADAAEVLRVELDAQWRAGLRPRVEEFLARLPPGDPEAAVDLIFCEYLLREEGGERPTPDEYAQRFPRYAAVVRDQIGLHLALGHTPAGTLTHAPTLDVKGGEPDPIAGGPFPRPFGRYTLLSVLGEGGMGVVYLAEDSRLGRRVALKLLRTGLRSGTAAERFRQEARLAASLDHPSLCPVIDVDQVEGRDYLTMPYLPGGTLAVRVGPDRPVPEGEAVRLVRRIAAALAVAHAAGVIHRDLKPANILFDAHDEPVVTDFGLARRLAGAEARLTGLGAVIGTPAYIPPEQIGGDLDAGGPASDVYGLGVILYELLTGRVPYTGSPGEVLQRVSEGNPPSPAHFRPDLNPGLCAACLKALARDPADRFPTMSEFAAALANPAVLQPRSRLWRWVRGRA